MSTLHETTDEVISAKLAESFGTPVLLLKSDIDLESFNQVVAELDGMGQQESLTVLLHSPGGFIENAF